MVCGDWILVVYFDYIAALSYPVRFKGILTGAGRKFAGEDIIGITVAATAGGNNSLYR